MIKFDVKVSKEDLSNYKRLQTSVGVFHDNLITMVSRGAVNLEFLLQYQNAQIEAQIAFNDARDKMIRTYIPEELLNHRYDWNIDYVNGCIHVSVYCDCGCEIIRKKKDIRYEDTGNKDTKQPAEPINIPAKIKKKK